MQIKLILILTIMLFYHPSQAADSKDLMKKWVRFALTYGEGTADEFDGQVIKDIRYIRNATSEVDLLFPVAIHLGYREMLTQRLNAMFVGANNSTTTVEEGSELYLTMAEAGLKAFIPIPVFQIWAGGGWLVGTASLNRPRLRNNHDIAVLYEREVQGVWGNYFHAGLDLMLFDGAGIRAYYQRDNLMTDKFKDLSLNNLNMVVHRWNVGIVGAF